MKDNRFERLKERTVRWVKHCSVVGSAGEVTMADLIFDDLAEIPYFKQNPERLTRIPTSDDPADERYSILAHVSGKRRSGAKQPAVLIIGHFDTVEIDDFGPMKPFACEPEELRALFLEQKDKFNEHFGAAGKRFVKDLENPDYLFGRGALDMKSGLAVAVELLIEHAENPDAEGDILVLALPDEEGNSAGMLSAVATLPAYAEKHRLDLRACVNTDYHSARYDGDPDPSIYLGTVGKIMPFFYIQGKETHAGGPFNGIDANALAAAILREIELNMTYADSDFDPPAAPPVSLKLSDLKVEYSTQTAGTAYVYFNFPLHVLEPVEVMDRMLAAARIAADRVLGSLNIQYDIYADRCGFPETHQPKHESIPCESLADYEARFAAAVGRDVFDELKAEAETAAATLSDDRDRTLAYIDYLQKRNPDRSPRIIACFSPPYYPPNTTLRNKPFVAAVKRAKERMNEQATSEYTPRLNAYYPFISDSSYVAWPQEERTEISLAKNMPGFGRTYRLPIGAMRELALPALNAGVYGFEAHQYTERLDMNYSFNYLPEFLTYFLEDILR